MIAKRPLAVTARCAAVRPLSVVPFLAISILYAIGLFLGPKVPAEEELSRCVRNVHLPLGLGTSVNCDSGNFLRIANDPRLLFERKRIVDGRPLVPGAMEQTTPALAVTVRLLQWPIDFVLDLSGIDLSGLTGGVTESLNTPVVDHIEGYDVNKSLPNIKALLSTYIAFVVTHGLILLCAAACYFAVLRRRGIDNVVLYACGLLIVNDVSKIFLYSPHSQFFNILAPALTYWLVYRIIEDESAPRAFLFGAALLGVLMLYYNVFAVCVVVLGVVYLYRRIVMEQTRHYGAIALDCVVGVILFGLPMLIWIASVIAVEGSFFIYDVEVYGGFGADGQVANHLVRVMQNSVTVVRSLLASGFAMIGLLAVTVLATIVKRRASGVGLGSFSPQIVAFVAYFLCLTLFTAAYGETSYRLVFGVAVMAVMLAIDIARSAGVYTARPSLALILPVLYAAYAYWTVEKYYPYSIQ